VGRSTSISPGKPVVEIWVDSVDHSQRSPELTPIGLLAKALASGPLLILVDRGLLDLEEAVTSN
jgi:hypothetical protein